MTLTNNAHIPIVAAAGEVSLLIETMPQITAAVATTSSIIPTVIEHCAVIYDITILSRWLQNISALHL